MFHDSDYLREGPPVERGDADADARERVDEGHSGRVHQIVALAFEARVGLGIEDENDISRHHPWPLVALPFECDLRAVLPPLPVCLQDST